MSPAPQGSWQTWSLRDSKGVISEVFLGKMWWNFVKNVVKNDLRGSQSRNYRLFLSQNVVKAANFCPTGMAATSGIWSRPHGNLWSWGLWRWFVLLLMAILLFRLNLWGVSQWDKPFWWRSPHERLDEPLNCWAAVVGNTQHHRNITILSKLRFVLRGQAVEGWYLPWSSLNLRGSNTHMLHQVAIFPRITVFGVGQWHEYYMSLTIPGICGKIIM